jgi:hypothetical protein
MFSYKLAQNTDLPPSWRKTAICSPQLPHSPQKGEHFCLLRPARVVNQGRLFRHTMEIQIDSSNEAERNRFELLGPWLVSWSFPIQGVGSEIVKRAQIELFRLSQIVWDWHLGLKILAPFHRRLHRVAASTEHLEVLAAVVLRLTERRDVV